MMKKLCEKLFDKENLTVSREKIKKALVGKTDNLKLSDSQTPITHSLTREIMRELQNISNGRITKEEFEAEAQCQQLKFLTQRLDHLQASQLMSANQFQRTS